MATDRIQLQVLRSKDVLSGSTADFEVAKHFDGVTSPKLPTSEQLEFGEIALNIAKGYEVISIKNYDGEIIYLPFNVAQRLLDTNVSLNDLKEYTITTIKSFSADTIVHFESVYDYINGINTQLSNSIQEAYNTLSGRIESVDETLTTTIESFSADVITQITKLGYALEGLNNKTESIIRASTELLNDKIDELSATTNSKIDNLKLVDLKDVEVSSPTITPDEFNVAIYEDNKLKTKIVGNTSTEKYGLVKVGSGITVNNGVISVVQIIDETVKSGSTNAVSSDAVYKEIKRVDGEISDINDKMAVISDEDIEDGVTDAPVVNIVNATYATQAMYDSEGHIIANIFSVASVLESRITELEKLVGRLEECERRLDVVESKIRLLESINYITY